MDPVEQSTLGPAANYSIGLHFLGIGNGFYPLLYSVFLGLRPPDTPTWLLANTQVVQWVNVIVRESLRITNGAALTIAIPGNTFVFSALGEIPSAPRAPTAGAIIIARSGTCWRTLAGCLFPQNTFSAPYHACVAISTSPDALGTYYVYASLLGNAFPDLFRNGGVWPETGYFHRPSLPGWGSFYSQGFALTTVTRCWVSVMVCFSTAEQVCLPLAGQDFMLASRRSGLSHPRPARRRR